jgi:predicted RNase H-like nuclease (RuvC/YqgF family)
MGISARDPRWKLAYSAGELHEMEEILREHGYDPKDAKKLQAEGMGPHELEHRIKSTTPGEMGSLEYTHRLKKLKTARSTLTNEQIAERLFAGANHLFDSRVQLRKDNEMLDDAYNDATAMVTQDLYADAQVKEVRDAMYKLDHQIGDVARHMENLARRIKGIGKQK